MDVGGVGGGGGGFLSLSLSPLLLSFLLSHWWWWFRRRRRRRKRTERARKWLHEKRRMVFRKHSVLESSSVSPSEISIQDRRLLPKTLHEIPFLLYRQTWPQLIHRKVVQKFVIGRREQISSQGGGKFGRTQIGSRRGAGESASKTFFFLVICISTIGYIVQAKNVVKSDIDEKS